MILRLVQPLSFPGHHALREEELDLEGRGEHLGEERAADEWPAHTRDLVWSKGSGEAGEERTKGGRVGGKPPPNEAQGRVGSPLEAGKGNPGGGAAPEHRPPPPPPPTFFSPPVP